MEPKFWLLLVTGLTPVIIGFIWYNPNVFGKAWMKSAKLTEEQLQGGNMIVLLILTYVFGVFVSFAMFGSTIHQSGMFSILQSDPDFMTAGSEANNYFKEFHNKYGMVDRNLGHGIFHGLFSTITFALPLIGMTAIYERRGWKYILIHTGFWAVCLMIIGGVLAQFV